MAMTTTSSISVKPAPAVGRGTETLRLRSEGGRVAALLRQARQHAVSQRRATRVLLDPGRNTVTLTVGDADEPLRELAMPEGIRLSVEAGGETLRFSSRGLTRNARWMLEGPGGRRLAIRVARGGRQLVVGLAPQGTPAPGPWRWFSAPADDRGEALLRDLKPGAYRVLVHDPETGRGQAASVTLAAGRTVVLAMPAEVIP